MFASLNIKKKKKKFPVFSFFFSIFPPLINHLENRLFFYLSHCCYNLCATLIQGVLWPTYGVTECFEGQGEEEFLCEILVINYWIIPISQGELRSVNGLLHLLQGFLCCQVERLVLLLGFLLCAKKMEKFQFSLLFLPCTLL